MHCSMFAVYPLDAEARQFARRKMRFVNSDAFECRICQRTFAKHYNLLIHERTHRGSCGSQSSMVSSASQQENDEPQQQHQQQHQSVVLCDVCGKVFRKAETMRNHRVSHSPQAVPKELKGFLAECITY